MRANLDNELEYPIDEETFESLTEKVLEQAILMRAAFQVDEDNEAAIARVSRQYEPLKGPVDMDVSGCCEKVGRDRCSLVENVFV